LKSFLRAFGRASQAVPWNSEESIREELFSIERLEQHAESLPAAQGIAAGSITGRSLAVRLKENESVLLRAYRDIAGAVGEGRAITPAAEWLLDNYHLARGSKLTELRYHRDMTTQYPAIGSKWKERDARVARTVEIIRYDVAKRRVRIACLETERLTWAKLERFNGKSGGYSPY
jgi:hypothetical protein